MSNVYTSPKGFQIARSDDGRTVRRAESGTPLEPGWHLMTEDEFEVDIDRNELWIEAIERAVDEEPPAS